MSDLGDAAARIGDKLSELLDVFDLSFFMSGALSMGAILMMLPEDMPNPLFATKPEEQLPGTAVFALVLGSYVLGLFCFAVGRPLRGRALWLYRTLRRKRDRTDGEIMRDVLTAQGLGGSQPLALAFGFDPARAGDPYTALYTRMWVHVRTYDSLRESFALLKRYWMLSAAYDGIAVAALLWLLPVWLGPFEWARVYDGAASAGILLVSFSCWHRAQLYKRYQIEELVATVAHWLSLVGRRELDGSAPEPTPSTASLREHASVEGPSAGEVDGAP
jgi:hypothetical protein